MQLNFRAAGINVSALITEIKCSQHDWISSIHLSHGWIIRAPFELNQHPILEYSTTLHFVNW
jgi:hypothetical protein